jgi:glycosyltransferase involved in cell wall biosynthesis
MISSPRVSIAMPVHNAAGTIHEALRSALAQTYEDLEILVVDNASTDGTPDIVRSYDDPRIVLHENATNIGAHRNANRSIQNSTGAHVKFLHADGVLHPTCVERMVGVMERSDRIGLVFARRLDDSFSHNWVGEPSSVMMRREALQRLGLFNPRVRMLTDVEMWARAMFHYDSQPAGLHPPLAPAPVFSDLPGELGAIPR